MFMKSFENLVSISRPNLVKKYYLSDSAIMVLDKIGIISQFKRKLSFIKDQTNFSMLSISLQQTYWIW